MHAVYLLHPGLLAFIGVGTGCWALVGPGRAINPHFSAAETFAVPTTLTKEYKDATKTYMHTSPRQVGQKKNRHSAPSLPYACGPSECRRRGRQRPSASIQCGTMATIELPNPGPAVARTSWRHAVNRGEVCASPCYRQWSERRWIVVNARKYADQ